MIKTLLLASAASALLAGAASAADLPRRAAPPPVFTAVPVFTWSGFYIGTQTGYVITDNGPIRTQGNDFLTRGNVQQGFRPAQIRSDVDGLTSLGGGIGYNYQFTPGAGFVVGFEADATWTDISKRPVYFSQRQDPAAFQQTLDWLGTVRGRLGYAFDRLFVYGTGGFAYGNVLYRANFFSFTPPNPLAYTGRFDGIETGFVYGGGIEYAIPTDSFLNRFNFIGSFLKADAVTLKAEYLHYDLGSRNVLVAGGLLPAATGSYTSRFRTEGDLIRAGFNYKFSGF
ncbi:outer membrane immunogenic protein [Methylobacterium sp. BE186]|uniref:outer membrane protein n=1 Tax=Methylobacterium sp. BE186 TaxID=2817715 RepID=UPI002861B2C5|nr:porin family protein [Methylobacterium sp. BE186]MDR7037503.1 outer membrane immunogenic protein [Methylobacterium sp. BE186]